MKEADIHNIETKAVEAERAAALVDQRVNSVEKAMADCKALQKERLGNIENTLNKLETTDTTIIQKIEKNKDNANDIELKIKDNQVSFNVLLSNVNDLIKLKNKMEARLSKLIIMIVVAIIIMLLTKFVDRYIGLRELEKKIKNQPTQVIPISHNNENLKKGKPR